MTVCDLVGALAGRLAALMVQTLVAALVASKVGQWDDVMVDWLAGQKDAALAAP